MRKLTSVRVVSAVVMAVVMLSAVLTMVNGSHEAEAQAGAAVTEMAYDDGTPFKTVRESIGGCEDCYIWQGVRFSVRGVAVASITAVRLYAGGGSGVLQVVITTGDRKQDLFGPVEVSVSTAGWYWVTLPDEVLVSGDFWVWVKKDGNVMPYHDAGAAAGRSHVMEHYKLNLTFPIPHDLMIRASVRAEIHVGEGRDYATIQEAVDAASPGLTVVVHEGTYTENVMVNKKLSIMSYSGPESTSVRAQNPGTAVFHVTESGAAISGFSIEGASGAGAAAVHLDGSGDCMVEGNTISGNYYGILVSATATGNVIMDNDIGGNVYGIWVDGRKTNIAGNRIEGNTAPLAPSVYLSGTAVENEVHFNSFTETGPNARLPQVYGAGTTQLANVKNNWWGDASGPYHSANATGAGVAVGDGVVFDPWLAAQPAGVKSATAPADAYSFNAVKETSTSVLKAGTGTPTVWVARYATNPGGEFPQGKTAIGKWVDVYLNSMTNIGSIEIRVHYTQAEVDGVEDSSLRLYWWDGSEWKLCSTTGVNTAERFVWARLTPTTTPALASLEGAPFAVGTTSAGFPMWWVLLGVVIVVVLAIAGWFLLKVLQRGGGYGARYEEEW